MTVDVFKALGDDTRREIIAALAGGPMPVHLIAARFDVSRPAISKHLKVLSDAGLVSAARDGKENVYALRPEGLDEVMSQVGRLWNNRLAALKALAERRT